MLLLIIGFIVLFIVIIAAALRNGHQNYRFGEGLFKSSEDNLNEKDNFEDKNYYHEDGLFK